jgi:hypothetical protein
MFRFKNNSKRTDAELELRRCGMNKTHSQHIKFRKGKGNKYGNETNHNDSWTGYRKVSQSAVCRV